MSSDDTVIIGKFKNEIRVAHVMASENLDYRPNYHGYNEYYLHACFHNSRAIAFDYDYEKDAMGYAQELLGNINKESGFPVEYGIRIITVNGPYPTTAKRLSVFT